MHRLDAGRDPSRREPRSIVGMEHLHVLDAGHQRRGRRERFQHAECGTDRGITDRVDGRRDPARGGSLRALAEAVRVGHPDAATLLGGEWPVRLDLDVREQRGGPRPRGSHRAGTWPAHGRPTIRVRAEARPAPVSAFDGRRDGVVAHARMDTKRQPAGVG